MEVEQCGDCKYFKKSGDDSIQHGLGICKRYAVPSKPEWCSSYSSRAKLLVNEKDWCGEYLRDLRRSKRLPV